MTFAEKLRELREAKGWSQKELAERSGNSQGGITKWERGVRVPGLDDAQALCKALGVRCTVFDECEHAKVEEGRGRGRPAKEKEEPKNQPAKSPKRRKGPTS